MDTARTSARRDGRRFRAGISPDGKRVAFETRDLSGPDGPRLWTAEPPDIGGRKVLPLVAGAINWAPMWLPIMGFAQAEYRRQFDLMPGGRQFLVLFPMGR